MKNFNPFTAPVCKMSRLKGAHTHTHTHTPTNREKKIWFYNLSHASANKQKRLKDLKFHTSLMVFSNDSVARMAVKELTEVSHLMIYTWCSHGSVMKVLSSPALFAFLYLQ